MKCPCRDGKPLRYSQSAGACVRKHLGVHTNMHSLTQTQTHTGRIEYENIAAQAGCVPAVPALMLAAVDGSKQSGHKQSSKEESEQQS